MPARPHLSTLALAVLAATTLPAVSASSAAAAPTAPAVVRGAVTPAQAAFIRAMVPGAQQGQRVHGVPASVTIAQAILESGWGTSVLTTRHKNYFGIKCTAANGPYATGCADHRTIECKGDDCNPVIARFRVYPSAAASLADHGRFLRVNSRYAPAFRTETADDFIRAVHKAGYATAPHYADRVIAIMNQYGLRAYDATS